jgi:hypothetical protein
LIREKSGVWNGSVLGWANGLDAGSGVADSALGAAAKEDCAFAAMASEADASNNLRIMSFLNINHLTALWERSLRAPERVRSEWTV